MAPTATTTDVGTAIADIPRLIMTEPTGDIIHAFGVLAGVLATTATPEQIKAMRAGGSPLAARVADAAADWLEVVR